MRLFLAPFIHLFLTAFFLCTKTMGIMLNGILGTTTGKIGGVVGATWKGRNTVRAYSKPGNPNTTAQQTQRGLFSFVLSIAKFFTSSIISNYWSPFSASITGFNAFVKANLLSITSDTDYDNIKLSQGSLESAPITAVELDGTSVDFTFDASVIGNGLATDEMVGVVIDSVNNVAYVNDSGVNRSVTSLSITVPAGLTVGDLKAYLFVKRGSGSSLIVSNSIYTQVTSA